MSAEPVMLERPAVQVRRALPGVCWAASEQAILDRYAREVVAGTVSDGAAAARRCREELDRLRADAHRRGRGRDFPIRRTLGAIHSRLCARARECGRRDTGGRWRPQERKIAIKHFRRLPLLQRKHPRWCILDSAREMLVELYENGFERSLDSCVMELWKHRRGRFPTRVSRPEKGRFDKQPFV
jgi:hypothetical protein